MSDIPDRSETILRREVKVTDGIGRIISYDSREKKVWVTMGWMPLDEIQFVDEASEEN